MYRNALKHPVDWNGTPIMVLLLKNAYVISGAHEFVSDVSANECSGGSYARQTLTTKTTVAGVGAVGSGDLSLKSANVAFGAITLADWRYIVVYSSIGTDGTSPLLVVQDYGAQSATAETLTVALSSAGWLDFFGLA